MRRSGISLVMAASALVLAACAVAPENDPHNLPYALWPSSSPDVNQYSTNPYPALTAPPLYAPNGGRD